MYDLNTNKIECQIDYIILSNRLNPFFFKISKKSVLFSYRFSLRTLANEQTTAEKHILSTGQYKSVILLWLNVNYKEQV